MTQSQKVTVLDLQAKKEAGERFSMVTAYDYPTALVADEAGIDAILVGDSLAMVVLGLPNTVSVTMEEMLHHCRAVARGAHRALLVGDMPFMSYANPDEAIHNAGRFLKEAGMDVVKLEGGVQVAEIVRAVVRAGIPVMGHIGLTPQTISRLGGFRVQGKDVAAIRRLIEDARALQEAGCFSIVLEAIPAGVARLITERLTIPTIGIGAGAACAGQVLVYHDLLGLYEGRAMRFVKRYAELGEATAAALGRFAAEVRAGTFPGPEHSFGGGEAAPPEREQ